MAEGRLGIDMPVTIPGGQICSLERDKRLQVTRDFNENATWGLN